MELELLLRYAVKGHNDLMGPNGLVPSMLAFGTILSFPMNNAYTISQQKRLAMMKSAQQEVAQIRAEE